MRVLGLLQRASRQEVLDAFDESITAVRSVLPTFDDAAMSETWRLVVDGREILAQPGTIDAPCRYWH